MALARVAGASIVAGAVAVLMRRALRCRPDWYDEPLADQPDDLFRELVTGRMTRSGYRAEMARLAATGEGGRPFVLPSGWER